MQNLKALQSLSALNRGASSYGIMYGNALNLASASTQYAYCVRASGAVDNFTIAFWIKVPSIPVGVQVLMLNGSNADHEGYNIQLDTAGKFILNMIFVNAGCKTSTAIVANTWTHIIFERDTGTSTAYINAVADGATSVSSPNAIAADSVTIIGANGNKPVPPSSINNALNALLDDFRIYDRAITSLERTALVAYAASVASPDISNTSLKAWWKFDEASGNPVDSSGNGKTLTAINTPTFLQGIVPIK